METTIKTFEDACKALEISAILPDVSSFPEAHRKSQLALYQLSIISKAINGGWIPDWKDTDQEKWYPVFEAVSSGFGFSYSDCVYWDASSTVGSRLCFETEEQADYVGKKFTELYNDLMSL